MIFFWQNKSKNLKTTFLQDFGPFLGTPCTHKIKLWNVVKTRFIYSSYAYCKGFTNTDNNWYVLEHILVDVYFAGQEKKLCLGCFWAHKGCWYKNNFLFDKSVIEAYLVPSEYKTEYFNAHHFFYQFYEEHFTYINFSEWFKELK